MVSQSELLSYVDGVGEGLMLSSPSIIMYAREMEYLRGEVSVRDS